MPRKQYTIEGPNEPRSDEPRFDTLAEARAACTGEQVPVSMSVNDRGRVTSRSFLGGPPAWWIAQHNATPIA